jgi:hypothetical protein
MIQVALRLLYRCKTDQGAAETQDPGSYCMDLNEANKKAWTLERKKSFFKNENK